MASIARKVTTARGKTKKVKPNKGVINHAQTGGLSTANSVAQATTAGKVGKVKIVSQGKCNGCGN